MLKQLKNFVSPHLDKIKTTVRSKAVNIGFVQPDLRDFHPSETISFIVRHKRTNDTYVVVLVSNVDTKWEVMVTYRPYPNKRTENDGKLYTRPWTEFVEKFTTIL